MRVFWPYALSRILHIGTIAALAFWLPNAPAFEVRLRRGDSVVLSAAFSQPAAPAEEAPAVKILPPEPIIPAPPPEIEAEERPAEAVEMAATSVEVPRSEYEVEIFVKRPTDAPEQEQAIVAKRSKQPTTEPQPSHVAAAMAHPPRRQAAPAPLPVGELSEAASFQAATELGSEVDQLPSQFLNNRKPEYPRDALLAGIEGVVNLRVRIDPAGRVTKVQLERSSGTPSLDQSAISGVRQWRFSPARRGGFAVSYEVIVPVRFSIRG